MSDIALIYDPVNGDCDITIANGDLVMDGGLTTAILISLLTWRQAEDDDVLPSDGIPTPGQANLLSRDRKGWWGDWYVPGTPEAAAAGAAAPPADRIGTRDWLLSREKELQSVVARAVEYWQQALQWMVDDGVAAKVEVAGEITRPGWLGRLVTITRPDGAQQTHRFDYAWPSDAAAPGIVITYPTPQAPAAPGQLDFSNPDNSGFIPVV